jgi:hypothetical protein
MRLMKINIDSKTFKKQNLQEGQLEVILDQMHIWSKVGHICRPYLLPQFRNIADNRIDCIVKD